MRKQANSIKRPNRLNLQAQVDSRDKARQSVTQPGDAVLIVRGHPRSLVMGCPCGCGEQLTINLDSRSGPAWRFFESNGEVTLYPSVWRESGCKSHFVIWQSRIYLFGQNDFKRRRNKKLERRVLKQLADGQPRHFADLANALDELPWSVLLACENLASDGKTRELEEPSRGTFIRPLVT
jgi:hypothetical protein